MQTETPQVEREQVAAAVSRVSDPECTVAELTKLLCHGAELCIGLTAGFIPLQQ